MESTLAFAAATWAIAMALGPVLQIRRIVDQQSSRGVSISYFLVLLIGFGLWFTYGVAAANLALIVPNVIAAIVMLVTIGVAFRYRQTETAPVSARESSRPRATCGSRSGNSRPVG